LKNHTRILLARLSLITLVLLQIGGCSAVEFGSVDAQIESIAANHGSQYASLSNHQLETLGFSLPRAGIFGNAEDVQTWLHYRKFFVNVEFEHRTFVTKRAPDTFCAASEWFPKEGLSQKVVGSLIAALQNRNGAARVKWESAVRGTSKNLLVLYWDHKSSNAVTRLAIAPPTEKQQIVVDLSTFPLARSVCADDTGRPLSRSSLDGVDLAASEALPKSLDWLERVLVRQ
jgi:hypothetical protein